MSDYPAPLQGRVPLTSFTVIRQIGEGATARTYLAREGNAARLTVLKEFSPARFSAFMTRTAEGSLALRPEYAYLQPEVDSLFAYFRKESSKHLLLREKLNGKKMSNLASVFDCKPVEGRNDLLRLETEEGFVLRELLDQRPVGLRDDDQFIVFCLRVASELAKALGALHHLGILYLDINPSNVYLSLPNPFEQLNYESTFSVTLLDMASAYEKKCFQQERFLAEEYLVSSGSTPGYTAPILTDARRAAAAGRMENFWKIYQNHPLDERLDYYSVAALICRMLLGRTPPVTDPDFSRVTLSRRGLLADDALRDRLTAFINKALMQGEMDTGFEYSEKDVGRGVFQKDLKELVKLANNALNPQTAARELYDKALAHLKRQAPRTVEPLLLSPAVTHRPESTDCESFFTLTEALEAATDGYRHQTSIRLIASKGSGKTTQLLRAGLALMTGSLSAYPHGRCVFLYLHASQIIQRKDGDLLKAVLQNPAFAFRASQMENSVNVIRASMTGKTGEMFLSHRFIFAIDGIDEVPDSKKSGFVLGYAA